MNPNTHPTIPAPRSLEEKVYLQVRAGELTISEARERVQASKKEKP